MDVATLVLRQPPLMGFLYDKAGESVLKQSHGSQVGTREAAKFLSSKYKVVLVFVLLLQERLASFKPVRPSLALPRLTTLFQFISRKVGPGRGPLQASAFICHSGRSSG